MSNWLATVSMPTKSSWEYFLVALPWIVMSSSTAADQGVRQVSTGTLMYGPLNREITSAGLRVGVGAAVAGSVGAPPVGLNVMLSK